MDRPKSSRRNELAPLDIGRSVLAAASEGLARLAGSLDDAFANAVDVVLRTRGNVVTSGIGKAGHIAGKVSATLASTGTPSFFLHPAEAMHGDLGRVGADDVVVLFSNSGGSQELLRLIPPLRGLGATLIAITGGRGSPLGAECDIVLPIGDCPEAGPLGLAPTTSTTVMLALGDALAMAVLGGRDFTPAQFARFHPGGALGRSLLRVSDVMRRGESNPVASADRTVLEVIDVMTSTPGKPGSVSIVDEAGRLIGFYTDGDFRRLVKTFVADDDLACLREPIARHMTRDPRSTSPDRLIAEAMRVLREHRIDQLPVVDAGHVPVGLLDVQDVLDVKVLP